MNCFRTALTVNPTQHPDDMTGGSCNAALSIRRRESFSGCVFNHGRQRKSKAFTHIAVTGYDEFLARTKTEICFAGIGTVDLVAARHLMNELRPAAGEDTRSPIIAEQPRCGSSDAKCTER